MLRRAARRPLRRTLDGINVALDTTIEILAFAAVSVAVICSISYRTFVWFVLTCWGKNTKGAVVGSIAKDDDGSVVYVVSYEFTVASAPGKQQVRLAKQTSRRSFRTKDVVAVRYWPTWPGISRLVERAV